MAFTKRNSQAYVAQDATDISGSSDSIQSLSAGAPNYALGVAWNDNSQDVSFAYNGQAVQLQKELVLYYDFATDGGAIGSLPLRGGKLPDNAVVTRTYYYVTTAVTSGGAATIGFGIPTDDAAGLLAATAIGTAGTAGPHDGIQSGAASAFSEITTAERVPTIDIGTATLTAGALKLVLEYEVMVPDTSS